MNQLNILLANFHQALSNCGLAKVSSNKLSDPAVFIERYRAAEELISPNPIKPEFHHCFVLATRYLVAQTYNEFRPEKADLLWKLYEIR
jgi:hypothetical protein